MIREKLTLALGLASNQHISRMERGVEACSIDLLVEISCVLRVSTDYLLMGKEPNREITRNELYSVILQLKILWREYMNSCNGNLFYYVVYVL